MQKLSKILDDSLGNLTIKRLFAGNNNQYVVDCQSNMRRSQMTKTGTSHRGLTALSPFSVISAMVFE